MKNFKIIISLTFLFILFSSDAFALQRVQNKKFYREDFNPYEHPQSLADFLERERLRKLQEQQAAEPEPVETVIPEYRRPANNFVSTPVFNNQTALQTIPPAPIEGLEYTGPILPKEESFNDGITLTPKLGTQGIGLEVGKALGDYVVLRGGGNFFTYSSEQSVNNIDYEGDINIINANALLDVHPTGSGFRLTGGAYFNPDKVEFKATPTAPTIIGNTNYTPNQIGTIEGEVEGSAVAPYAGVGYSRAFRDEGDWFFDVDAGVKINSLNSTITSNGLLASNPTFRQNLETERKDIEDKLGFMEYYPILKMGFGYKF